MTAMTEEEARTKWCPFVRAVAEGSRSAANRYPSAASDSWIGNHCIASDCMAWRWLFVTKFEPAKDVTEPASMTVTEDAATYGFCGLAGRPRR